MTKLTETQTIILSAGSPAPRKHRPAAAQGAGRCGGEDGRHQDDRTRLAAGGRCQPAPGEPLWRETGDGHGTTLVVTDAGLLAIGIEPVVVKTPST
jgi:hypothetical protein